LRAQIQLATTNDPDTELMKLCCVQLFGLACEEDILLIWEAKESCFDAACSLDIEFLCGCGLENTIAFLEKQHSLIAKKALERLLIVMQDGCFDDFLPEEWIGFYEQYYANYEDEDN
jgi:hypothetical protein